LLIRNQFAKEGLYEIKRGRLAIRRPQ